MDQPKIHDGKSAAIRDAKAVLSQQSINDLDRQTFGTPIGRNDRNGNPIHVGDTLRFDPEEWTGGCEFQILIRDGKITGKGTSNDWSNWCWIVKKYNA